MKGIRFFFKGKPYEVLTTLQCKVYGQWMECIVYKALYSEEEVSLNQEFARVCDSTPEWYQFLEAINKSKLSKQIVL